MVKKHPVDVINVSDATNYYHLNRNLYCVITPKIDEQKSKDKTDVAHIVCAQSPIKLFIETTGEKFQTATWAIVYINGARVASFCNPYLEKKSISGILQKNFGGYRLLYNAMRQATNRR